MQNELRKLAAAVRKSAEENKDKKRVKCAHIVQASVALELLRRKIGG